MSASVSSSFHAKISTRGTITSQAVSSSSRNARSTRRFSAASKTPSSSPSSWISSNSRCSLARSSPLPPVSRSSKCLTGAVSGCVQRATRSSVCAEERAIRTGLLAATACGITSVTIVTVRIPTPTTPSTAPTVPQMLTATTAAAPSAVRLKTPVINLTRPLRASSFS